MRNEKGDSNVTDGGNIQVLPWGIKQIYVTAVNQLPVTFFLKEPLHIMQASSSASQQSKAVYFQLSSKG